MTYESFKQNNDASKRFFYPSFMRIEEVNFKTGQCTVSYQGNTTKGVSISSIVEDVLLNEMGALSNPSKLKNWSGFKN